MSAIEPFSTIAAVHSRFWFWPQRDGPLSAIIAQERMFADRSEAGTSHAQNSKSPCFSARGLFVFGCGEYPILAIDRTNHTEISGINVIGKQ